MSDYLNLDAVFWPTDGIEDWVHAKTFPFFMTTYWVQCSKLPCINTPMVSKWDAFISWHQEVCIWEQIRPIVRNVAILQAWTRSIAYARYLGSWRKWNAYDNGNLVYIKSFIDGIWFILFQKNVIIFWGVVCPRLCSKLCPRTLGWSESFGGFATDGDFMYVSINI